MTTSQCDRTRIDKFLLCDDSVDANCEMVEHLEQCLECRKYIDSRAAQPEDCLEVRRMLEPTEFDLASLPAFTAGNLVDGEAGRSPSIQAVLSILAPSENPHRLGRIGPYEICGVVGSGGMGVVLKAMDPSLDRVVAIKVLAPHLANDATARMRFARESRAAAAVLHPNVIPIHSVSSDDQMPCLVMSYIRGGSLQKRLEKENTLSVVEILRIGSQVAAGLAAAHSQGLVHRDIKPANILIEEGVDRVALTDFGLARAVDDTSVTREGSIAGTPQFMSPEQARGESVDQKSDLFSLGSVLYALCCGSPPFRAESSYAVMRQICDKTPTPIIELNPDVPEWLCLIIYKLMAKEKTARFESAAEVSKLLETCLRQLQQPTEFQLPDYVRTVCQSERQISLRFFRFLRTNYRGGYLVKILIAVTILGLTAWLLSGDPSNRHLQTEANKLFSQKEGALLKALQQASEDTEYSSGYSEEEFQKIKIGETIESVNAKLGAPIRVNKATPYTSWLYAPKNYPDFAVSGKYPSLEHACNVITFDGKGKFVRQHGQQAGVTKTDGDNTLVVSGEMSLDGNTPGPLGISNAVVSELIRSKADMEKIRDRYGMPRATYSSKTTKWLVYSHSPSGGDYSKRMLGIDEDGRVCEKKSEFYWD